MRRVSFWIAALFAIVFFSGCDILLDFLQPEIAQEKRNIGDVYGYNPKVEELQTLLRQQGYNPGPVDGRLGRRTREAVKQFQKDYNLKVTGFVDNKTWKKLHEYKREEVDTTNISVSDIQRALKRAGFDPGPVDGKMGKLTRRAIQEFQKKNGLIPDGVVGPNTLRKLMPYILK